MSLINNDHWILLQQRILLDFLKQNTISHKLDQSSVLITKLSIISHLVTTQLANLTPYFVTHSWSKRRCCHSPWLGDPYPSEVWVSCLIQELRNLSWLSRPCLSAYNRDQVRSNSFKNFSFMKCDRQIRLWFTCLCLRYRFKRVSSVYAIKKLDWSFFPISIRPIVLDLLLFEYLR